jgi:hypothetical protein
MSHDVVFISTPNHQAIAIDAKSGNILWRYRRPRPADGPRAGDGQGVYRASIDEVNEAHKHLSLRHLRTLGSVILWPTSRFREHDD